MNSKRLARLVRLRELVEKTHVGELEERKRSLVEAEQLLATTCNRMESLGYWNSTASAEELMRLARYQAYLGKQAEQQKDEISQREAAVLEGLEIVRRAWQDRRLLQHIQSNAEQQEGDQAQKREWKEQDAQALNAYVKVVSGKEDNQ